jgi:subtilase family serine protease
MRQRGGTSTIGGSRLTRLGGPLVAVAVACVLAVPGAAWAAASSANPAADAGSANAVTPVCAVPSQGFVGCHAIRLDNPADWQGQHVAANKGPTAGASTPSGYGPIDLQSAYNLAGASSTAGANKTVAIVDAYDDPTANSDLATYRSHFGLPPLTLTTVYASGTKPSGNTGWAEEESLDVDMVSAICPNCSITLVEAASNSYADLATAMRTAASLPGVVAVSNSYGGSDSSSDSTFDGSSYFNFVNDSGIAVTASSGDGGYGVEYPAASPYVTAVGGTHLTKSSGVWSETVWSGAGSGCSKYESAPSWQPKTSLCATRTVADVSADADPNTGVAVYDTDGEPGWLVFGGTSVASPIIASVYALGGGTTPSALYGSSALRQIKTGSNSGSPHHPCTSYLCNAADSLGGSLGISYTPATSGLWYNGPTGNGTPNGDGAF